MVFERLEDRIDDVSVGAIAASHMNVSRRIERPFLVGEALQRPFRIAVAQQWPGVSPRGPVGENIDGRVEPDGDRTGVQQFARPRVDEDTATGRNHPDLAVDQSSDQAPLAIAIILLAIAFEHFRGGQPRRVFNRRVTVHKRQAQPLREAAADCRFADAHQADENDRAVEALDQMLHGWGYTAAGKLGQKPAPD